MEHVSRHSITHSSSHDFKDTHSAHTLILYVQYLCGIVHLAFPGPSSSRELYRLHSIYELLSCHTQWSNLIQLLRLWLTLVSPSSQLRIWVHTPANPNLSANTGATGSTLRFFECSTSSIQQKRLISGVEVMVLSQFLCSSLQITIYLTRKSSEYIPYLRCYKCERTRLLISSEIGAGKDYCKPESSET